MSLVSDFANAITGDFFNLNQQENIVGADFAENSFEDILNKQLENQMNENNQKTINNLDMPNGINIVDLISATNNNNVVSTNPIGEVQAIDLTNLQNGDLLSSTPEVLTFYPSLFQIKGNNFNTNETAVFDLERKIATNIYDKYSRSMVNDINEFVSDALKK